MMFKVLAKVLLGSAAADDRSEDEAEDEGLESEQGVVGTTSAIAHNSNMTPTKRK